MLPIPAYAYSEHQGRHHHMVGIVAMIDSAVFILTGPAIGLACNAVKLEFIVSATITLLTAMACTELGLTMQQEQQEDIISLDKRWTPTTKYVYQWLVGWMDISFAHIIQASLMPSAFWMLSPISLV